MLDIINVRVVLYDTKIFCQKVTNGHIANYRMREKLIRGKRNFVIKKWNATKFFLTFLFQVSFHE